MFLADQGRASSPEATLSSKNEIRLPRRKMSFKETLGKQTKVGNKLIKLKAAESEDQKKTTEFPSTGKYLLQFILEPRSNCI